MLLKLPCSIFHLSSFIFHLSLFCMFSVLYVFCVVCFCSHVSSNWGVSVFCRCLCRCCGRRVCAKRWVCVSVVCLSELQKLTPWQTWHWKPPKRWDFVAIKCVRCVSVCQKWPQKCQIPTQNASVYAKICVKCLNFLQKVSFVPQKGGPESARLRKCESAKLRFS